MNKSILLRSYLPQDLEATIDVFVRAFCEVASRDYSPAQIDAWAAVSDPITSGKNRLNRPTWIAEYCGKVIGFSNLIHDGCLDMMYVHLQFQGIGIASLLLVQVEEEAKRLDLHRIYTEASLTARPFFEHKGFKIVKEQTVEKRGQIFANFVMEKHYN